MTPNASFETPLDYVYYTLMGEQAKVSLLANSTLIPDGVADNFCDNNLLFGVVQYFIPPLPDFVDEIRPTLKEQQEAFGAPCMVLAGAQWMPSNTNGAASSTELLTLVIPLKDVSRISAHVTDDTNRQEMADGRSGFMIDSEISAMQEKARHLTAWAADGPIDKTVEWGEEQGEFKPGAWDQFHNNKALYNIDSTFDETMYTTTMDSKTMGDEKKMMRATKLADEIERKGDRYNDYGDDEATYGAVMGTGAYTRGSKSGEIRRGKETSDQLSSLMVRHSKKKEVGPVNKTGPAMPTPHSGGQEATAPRHPAEAPLANAPREQQQERQFRAFLEKCRDDGLRQLHQINTMCEKMKEKKPEYHFNLSYTSAHLISNVCQSRSAFRPNTAIGQLIIDQRRSLEHKKADKTPFSCFAEEVPYLFGEEQDKTLKPAVLHKLKGALGLSRFHKMIHGVEHVFLNKEYHQSDLRAAPCVTSEETKGIDLSDEPLPVALERRRFPHVANNAPAFPFQSFPNIQSPFCNPIPNWTNPMPPAAGSGMYSPGTGFVLMCMPMPTNQQVPSKRTTSPEGVST